MINKKEQIEKILNVQLRQINENINKLPEGKEKEFLKQTVKELKENKTLNTEDFINKFVNVTGQTFNAEKLKEMTKKFGK